MFNMRPCERLMVTLTEVELERGVVIERSGKVRYVVAFVGDAHRGKEFVCTVTFIDPCEVVVGGLTNLRDWCIQVLIFIISSS